MRVSSDAFLDEYQFTDDDFLGRGAFGQAYLAQSKLRNKSVVVKLFKDVSKTKDIEKEIYNAINLEHPNLIRYYGFYDVQYPGKSQKAAIIEYANKGNLTTWLEDFPDDEALRKKIFMDILKGLQKLDDERLIHKDLKLQNVLLHYDKKEKELSAKLADFGMASKMDSIFSKMIATNSSNVLEGTPQYIAPELLNNDFAVKFNGKPRIKTNSDLWAFGVILYFLFLKEYPLAGNSRSSTHSKILIDFKNQEIDHSKISKIPEPYQQIVKRCLIKDASERVQSPDELLKILNSRKYFSSFTTKNQTGNKIQIGTKKRTK